MPAAPTVEAPRLPKLILTGAALGLSFLGGGLPRTLALAAIGRAAAPSLRHAWSEVVTVRRPTVALLDAAVLLIMLLTGDVRGAALTHLLVLVGEEIRALTARRTRRGTLDLDQTLGRTAWLVLGAEQVRVPAERLQVDDVVAVHAGEQVPVDGMVVGGEARQPAPADGRATLDAQGARRRRTGGIAVAQWDATGARHGHRHRNACRCGSAHAATGARPRHARRRLR